MDSETKQLNGEEWKAEAGLLLSSQVSLEYNAFYFYTACAAHFENPSVCLKGLTKFFKKSSAEENEHAQKIIEFMNMRELNLELRAIEAPDIKKYGKTSDILKACKEFEQTVLNNILTISKIAENIGDLTIVEFFEDFIAEQLRSTQNQASQKDEEEEGLERDNRSQHTNMNTSGLLDRSEDTGSVNIRDLDYQTPQDPFMLKEDEEKSALENHLPIDGSVQYNAINEPTSSQGQIPFYIMKLDFDLLKQVKKEDGIEADTANIRESKKYKIDGEFAAIVKRLDRFSKDVVRLELVDVNGAIYGSCPLRVVNDLEIRIGSILVLSGCSLWRVGDNHLNITAENIKKII